MIQKVILMYYDAEDKSNATDIWLVLIRKIQILTFSTFSYLKAILTLL